MDIHFYFHICGVSFFFQAEDGIRDVERSRGLGDVYKRQVIYLQQYSAAGVPVLNPSSGV